jgi:hypothetical protein
VSDLKYIIKIGDFGLACKYSVPYLLNDAIKEDWMLDFFCPLYDLMQAFSLMKGTSPFYKMIQIYLFEGDRAVDLINHTYDIDEFDAWIDSVESKLSLRCENVTFLRNVRKMGFDYKNFWLHQFVNDNYHSKFLCSIIKNNKFSTRKRNNYNFRLDEMYKKDHINVTNLTSSKFFNARLSNLGYLSKPENGSKICLFGDA